jgi:hypothetical protein
MYRKWAKALQSHVAEEFSDKNVKMSMFNAIMKDYIKPTEQLD